jgi:hypothetical protein
LIKIFSAFSANSAVNRFYHLSEIRLLQASKTRWDSAITKIYIYLLCAP